MLEPTISPLDRHLPVEIRSMLEERLCRPVGDGLTVEALLDDDLLFIREWFHPYESTEISEMLAKVGGG